MLGGWDDEWAPMKLRRNTYTNLDTHKYTHAQHAVNNAKLVNIKQCH